jgi:hypothetical protein
MPSEPSSDQQQPDPFDANTRQHHENDATFWFDEYEATFRRLWEDEVEIVKLRGRISELELQVRSQAPTDEAIRDLSTADLLHFARACAALARVLVAELRARHVELPNELRDL